MLHLHMLPASLDQTEVVAAIKAISTRVICHNFMSSPPSCDRVCFSSYIHQPAPIAFFIIITEYTKPARSLFLRIGQAY